MASPPTPDFEALIATISRELEAVRIPFMLIGGQAVLLHGEPRLTADVDITLGVSPEALDGSGEEIDWEYVERWAAEFATIPGRETLPDLVRQLRSFS